MCCRWPRAEDNQVDGLAVVRSIERVLQICDVASTLTVDGDDQVVRFAYVTLPHQMAPNIAGGKNMPPAAKVAVSAVRTAVCSLCNPAIAAGLSGFTLITFIPPTYGPRASRPWPFVISI